MFFSQMHPADATGLTLLDGDVTELYPILVIPSNLILAGVTQDEMSALLFYPVEQMNRFKPSIAQKRYLGILWQQS